MIRFTWLQARTQTVVAFGALVIVAIVLAATGPHLVHLYNANLAPCGARAGCEVTRDAFLRNDKSLASALGALVLLIPGIIGLFWGPALVARELETGTFRLAWTQSVTRTRWLAIKLAVVGIISMTVAGLLSLIVTWWASPLDTAHANRFVPPMFDERGVVAIGYTAFAFALGVTAGVVIRRTLPAMATTLVAFTAARLAVIHWIRPKFIAATVRSIALQPGSVGFGRRNSGPITLMPEAPTIPNAWIHSTHIVDKGGHALTPQVLATLCPRLGTDLDPGPPPGLGHAVRAQVPADVKSAVQNCVAKVGATYHEVVTYQPAKHYWAFQWYELALFLGAALVLSGFCIWWVRRRLA